MGKAKALIRDADSETKQRLRERPQPSKLDVICPAVFEATGAAVNYDLTPLTSTKFVDHNGKECEDFLWKSTPGDTRGHAAATYKLIDELREKGEITWNEKAYYFTHQEGKEAAEKYMKHVVSGEPFTIADGTKIILVANKKSWNNRFADMCSVSYDKLVQNHPDIYNKPAAKKVQEKQEAEEAAVQNEVEDKPIKRDPNQDELTEVGLEEPTEVALREIEEFEDERQEVTAAIVTDNEVREIIEADDEEVDDLTVTKLRLTGFDTPARLSEDCFVRSVNGEDVTFYEVELPDFEHTLFVPAGLLDFTQMERYELIEPGNDD